ncbi:TonB-dependent receptor [Sphingomonas flavalba]|uniref:TonB-dependent receptor n=1 Tax=Sphingomonas flavalba TaxID=2559804 RepID=UPI00109DC32C|nr:TonB-dependent receptor [Sphingomonas flavalba]
MRKPFAVLPLLLATPALAEAPDIVVTGGGLAPSIGETAYDLIVIDRERIDGTASGRVEDVLRDVAGLQQFRRSDARSAHPTSQGLTLRGLGGNASSRALLVLDGVPQSDPFGGSVTLSAYTPERLGTIRVTRGGGAGALGPGALAGTIELESADAGTLPGLAAGLAYGSRDAVDANAGVAGRLGAGHASVSAAYARGDGFVPILAGQRGSVDRPAPYEQASLAARAVVPVGAATELQASMLGFVDRRERGTAYTDNSSRGADASIRLVGRGAWGWSALAYLQARSFAGEFASIAADRNSISQSLDQYNTPATGLGARVELRPPVGQDIELRLGADWRRTSGRTQELATFVAGAPTRGRVAGGRTDTLGAFAEASAKLGTLTLTGGGRIDHWAIANGRLREWPLAGGPMLTDSRFADRSGWRPTARAGVAWAAAPALTLRAAAYTGWRLPTLNELYRPFRAGADATAANAALKPERMRGAELGADWRPTDGVSVGATLFTSRLDDAIANITLASGPGTFPGVGFVSAAGVYRQRGNLDRITARGIEFDASARLGDFALAASYAHTRSTVHASGAAAPLDGLRPAQTPRHMASATLGWRWLSTTLRYVSAQYEDDQNARALTDALTVDARIAVPLTGGLTVELRGENIGNTRVDATISGAGIIERTAPRTVWFGLNWRG